MIKGRISVHSDGTRMALGRAMHLPPPLAVGGVLPPAALRKHRVARRPLGRRAAVVVTVGARAGRAAGRTFGALVPPACMHMRLTRACSAV